MSGAIWVEEQPEQSLPGAGQGSRSGGVWIQDASLGLIISRYTSGWSPYEKQSESALFDGVDIQPDNDYQIVRQRVLHALEGLLKQDDGDHYYHSGNLEGFAKPPTVFHVQANHQQAEVNGKWTNCNIEDDGKTVTYTLPNGLSKTVADHGGNRFRVELRWIPGNELNPISMSGIRLGFLTCHSQRDYHDEGSWTHEMWDVTDWEWKGTCELGRKCIDGFWSQKDVETARKAINDSLNRALGVRP